MYLEVKDKYKKKLPWYILSVNDFSKPNKDKSSYF